MYKKIANAKPVVKKHLARTATFIWSKILKDPRSQVNRIWDFDYLMNTIWNGMLTNCLHLRAVEDFSESYDERVPDTTLHDLIVKLSPVQLEKLLVKEVKKSLRSHELPKTDFPVRITAIDGKCVSVSKNWIGEFSQLSNCNGAPQYLNRVLRAVTVSNELKLTIGQRTIHASTSEMGEFKNFLKGLVADYSKTGLLEVISVDAGMNSLDNANFTIENELDYIMGLKNPQKNLVKYAKETLGKRTNPDKITDERVNGKQIRRKLFRKVVMEYPGWSHLKEIWRIRQETTVSSGKQIVEERYFITSLSPGKLSNTHVLKAIRMHWGIENNANWIMDTVWKEDDSPWCNKGFLFVCTLRVLAYNIISRLLTRRLRKKDGRERSWKGIKFIIQAVLLQSQIEKKLKETSPVFN